jgi:hypothetical protein
MAGTNKNISKVTKVTIPDSLLYKMQQKAFEQISNRINNAQEEANFRAAHIIMSAIEQSPVFKGIAGKFSNFGDGSDLQAEFGLTDQMRDNAIARMTQVLKETIRVDFAVEKTFKSYKIFILVQGLDPDEYKEILENGSEFRYTNIQRRTGIRTLIPWMKWALNPKDFNDALFDGYGITYVGTFNRSRSKRAAMVKEGSKRLSRNFPYELPSILESSGKSDNFIEEIRNSKELKKLLGEAMQKIILKYIKR